MDYSRESIDRQTKIQNMKDAGIICYANSFSGKRCYEYANEEFNSRKMTIEYLKRYEKVISSEHLNKEPPKLKEIQKQKFLEWH